MALKRGKKNWPKLILLRLRYIFGGKLSYLLFPHLEVLQAVSGSRSWAAAWPSLLVLSQSLNPDSRSVLLNSFQDVVAEVGSQSWAFKVLENRYLLNILIKRHFSRDKIKIKGNGWGIFFFFFFFCFLGPPLRHMEVPSLGDLTAMLPSAYRRATARPDPSSVCDLYHSSQQRRILNPLSKARDRTENLMVPGQIHFQWATTGTPANFKSSSWALSAYIWEDF